VTVVPPKPIRQLRDLARYRTDVVRERARDAQRLQNLLEDCGIKLTSVDWKYALGAELGDTGFDAGVLSKFRTRPADHGLERVAFDRLLDHCKGAGLDRPHCHRRNLPVGRSSAICNTVTSDNSAGDIPGAPRALNALANCPSVKTSAR
jgi:hypothetical protein